MAVRFYLMIRRYASLLLIAEAVRSAPHFVPGAIGQYHSGIAAYGYLYGETGFGEMHTDFTIEGTGGGFYPGKVAYQSGSYQ